MCEKAYLKKLKTKENFSHVVSRNELKCINASELLLLTMDSVPQILYVMWILVQKALEKVMLLWLGLQLSQSTATANHLWEYKIIVLYKHALGGLLDHLKHLQALAS